MSHNNSSFKTRVKNSVIAAAQDYNAHFVQRDYLICSDAFQQEPFYIISAHEDNFLHLTGVSSNIDASEFFHKSLDGTLTEADFEIAGAKRNKNINSAKGSIRRKINSLPKIRTIFSPGSMVEEGFQKNHIFCSVASTDSSFTLGFITTPEAVPKTLLKGNELDGSKSGPLSLVLSKERGEEKYGTLLVGTEEELAKHYNDIKGHIAPELIGTIDASTLTQNSGEDSLVCENEDFVGGIVSTEQDV